MAVLKVIEVLASSEKSWEAATREGIKRASKTVNDIKSAYVKDQSVVINNNDVAEFRVNLKITFAVGE